jgi:hypothetical protein
VDVHEAMEKAAADLETEPVETPAAPEPAAASETAPEPKEQTAAQRARDEAGRFASTPKPEKVEKAPEPKAETRTAVPVKGPTTQTPPPVAPEPPAVSVKAPQSWKPAAREAFAKAPPEVQQEALRRESEITRTLQETAQARQFAQTTHQAISAYEGVARTRGLDSMTWAGEALQERAILQAGPTTQRAPILARMLAEGGQDLIQQVASILDGQAAPQHAPQPQPVNIQAEVQRAIQAERQQMMAGQADQAVRAFVATQPEYLNDVAHDMVAVLNAAAQSNDPALRNMTPEEAYDRACWMNPEIRERIQKSKQAEAARTPQPVTEQQRRAAASVRSQPAPAPAGKPKGIKEAMERAADDLGMSVD